MSLVDRARQELDRRAARLAVQRFLTVSYYRIRRRLALPLPVVGQISPAHPVRGYAAAYPWSIWLAWALEDRMVALGDFVCRTSDPAARIAVEADLRALATLRQYRSTDRPDLPYAHAVRPLWVAWNQWRWLADPLRAAVGDALNRAVEDALPLSERLHGRFDSLQSLLEAPDPHQHLHNIPVIGTCALALAAKAVSHPASPLLDARVGHLFGAVLALRQRGFTESVSYDGYVLDFVADWLLSLDASARGEFLSHPEFDDLVGQALELSAPGEVMNTAPLGDVEPFDMPFVWSALAKLQAVRADARAAWALSQCDVSHLRADALVSMARSPSRLAPTPEPHSPERTNHAVVLRSGYGNDDVAAAIGASNSPMGHVHCDNGNVVLGTRGLWWLDDPGYQQYLDTSERRFTVGIPAHNAPVINGHAQTLKQPGPSEATHLTDDPEVQFALFDLTACYPADAGANRVRRAIWLLGKEHLVVCDDIAAPGGARVGYHWHGHPSLFWHLQDNAATMVSEGHPDRWLHLFSPQIAVGPSDLHRLPGSRGQQTLMTTVTTPVECSIWWVFSFAAERPSFRVNDRAFMVGDWSVPLDGRLLPRAPALTSPTRVEPLLVTAFREGDTVEATCVVDPGHFGNDPEFAFYLMVGGQRALVRWYNDDPHVAFDLPDSVGKQPLEVRGFVRKRADPSKKTTRTAPVIDRP